MNRFSALSLSLSLSLALGACLSGTSDDPHTETSPAALTTSTTPAADGVFELRTTVALSAANVLPQAAYDAVGVLHGLRTAPADTIAALLDQAGIPFGNVFASLPSGLRTRIRGWIDSYVQSAVVDGRPVTDVIEELVALIETALTRVDLVSELDLIGIDAGDDQAEHRLLAVDFTPAGLDAVLPLADLPDPRAVLTDSAEVSLAREGSRARLAVGSHRFGLPWGELLWTALDESVAARTGRDIRGLLGHAVDCPALAASVANRCVVGVCVGHAPELTAMCETGLDLAVARLRDRLGALRFDAVRFADGQATLRDSVPGDDQFDRVDDGRWTAAVDLGQGPRPVTATFVGARR